MDSSHKLDNKQFLDNMYQHTRYTNNIHKHQIVTIFAQPRSKTFSLTLHEPLKIDSISDVYLDNFTTFDIGAAHNSTVIHKQFFILKIDQFPLNSLSNKTVFNNAIIIPNDDVDGSGTVKVHKGKKMNYITTLMPGTIDKITGTITDWSGGAIFQDNTITINTVSPGSGLTIILTVHVSGGDGTIITLTSDGSGKGLGEATNGTTGTFSGTGSTAELATAIVASINDVIAEAVTAQTPLEYTVTRVNNVITITPSDTGTTITVSGSYADLAGMTPGHPHFLAEFLISKRD